MDEEEMLNVSDIDSIKKVLKYLVTQEKIRQQEVEALKEMVLGVDSYAKAYVDDQNFNAFKEQYGEKLEPFAPAYQKMEGDDFDLVRETYNNSKDIVDDNYSMEQYVADATALMTEDLQKLKEVLGLPEDAAVEVKTDENGEVEIKADTDGDGETEPISENTEETPAEENAPEKESEELDEETRKSIDEAVDSYKPMHS